MDAIEKELKDISTKYKEADNLMGELDGEWDYKSNSCPHHKEEIGECGHSGNDSSDIVSCSPSDCPLSKLWTFIGG